MGQFLLSLMEIQDLEGRAKCVRRKQIFISSRKDIVYMRT